MTTADASRPTDVVVIPENPTPRDAGVTLAELLASFYLWLLLWLVAWAAIPALLLGWQPVLITSGSMGPTISPGDVVLLADPPADEVLEPGTVITFDDPNLPGGLITHRIDGVREDGMYRTRGDANASPDSDPVPHHHVVGVGRMLVPLVGLPVQWLRTDIVSFGLFIAGTIAAAIAASAANRAGRARLSAAAAAGGEPANGGAAGGDAGQASAAADRGAP